MKVKTTINSNKTLYKRWFPILYKEDKYIYNKNKKRNKLKKNSRYKAYLQVTLINKAVSVKGIRIIVRIVEQMSNYY